MSGPHSEHTPGRDAARPAGHGVPLLRTTAASGSPYRAPDKADKADKAAAAAGDTGTDASQISAYARLDFAHHTFFVQTLQVVLGRKSGPELLLSFHHSVDVHLSSTKAILRRHAKIFYNFGTQRFEVLVMGRNGAFVNDRFVAQGLTVPLSDCTKLQIGDIPFTFVLPSVEPGDGAGTRGAPGLKLFNPADALNLRSNLYLRPGLPKRAPSRPGATAAAGVRRRDSRAELVRRLSVARRKSLASSSNDEISALLKELEAFSGDADTLGADAYDPTEFQREEDEIDELVKQHNLGEGVGAGSPADSPAGGVLAGPAGPAGGAAASPALSPSPPAAKDLAMDINILDQEVASLAPLIDGHHEKPEMFAARSGISKTSSLQHLDTPAPVPPMGKAFPGPRMGKPATIQPPANRVYGRPPGDPTVLLVPMGLMGLMGHIGQASQMGHAQLGPPVPGGFPPHTALQAGAPASHPSGYAVTAPPSYAAYGGFAGSPYMRPAAPRLEVAVATIARVEIHTLFEPLRAIKTHVGAQRQAAVCVPRASGQPSVQPKLPVRRRDLAMRRPQRPPPPKDVPEQHKTKPAVTILAMISAALRSAPTPHNGCTITEIHEKIRELYPYYRYCPDGWQFPVTHNLRFNKTFRATSRPSARAEWRYIIDHAYIADRDRVRRCQQEAAVARAKDAALRAADYRVRPGAPFYGLLGRPYVSTDGPKLPGGLHMLGAGLQRPKAMAEVAGEARREGAYGSVPPFFQRQSAMHGSTDLGVAETELERFRGTIKDQLAANRAKVAPQLGKPPSSTGAHMKPRTAPPAAASGAARTPGALGKTGSPSPLSSQGKPATMAGDTKKSLGYLQKELFTLYKARNLTYNTSVTTEIITKALATTIAQVNIIGAKAGCGDNALGFLVEKAPQQVSKILDIALTKAIKERQVLSGSSSRSLTPQTGSPTATSAVSVSDAPPATSRAPRASSPLSSDAPVQATRPLAAPLRSPYAGLSKPQSFSKPGTFVRPQYGTSKPRPLEKRPSDEPDGGRKVAKANPAAVVPEADAENH